MEQHAMQKAISVNLIGNMSRCEIDFMIKSSCCGYCILLHYKLICAITEDNRHTYCLTEITLSIIYFSYIYYSYWHRYI